MSIVRRFEREIFTQYIPWIIYIGIMMWIQLSITGTLSNAVSEFEEVYGQAASVFINIIIPFILVSGMLLNTVSFLMRRTWIAFFSVFLVMLVSFVIYYGLSYPSIVNGIIPYRFFSDVVSNIFLDLFLALIPTLLFTYLLNIFTIDRKNVKIKVQRKLYIPIDLLLATSITVGLALFTLYLNQLFHTALVDSLEYVPKEISPLIRDFINMNLGQLLIILAFLSFITYIIYGLAEPLTIYFGGLTGQARDLIQYEYSKITKKDYRLLKPSITYILIRGIPYLGFTLLIITYNYLYIDNLMVVFDVGNIPSLLVKMITVYSEDILSFSHTAPVTPGDINLLNVINWRELEIYIETLRAIIRFLFRLIF